MFILMGVCMTYENAAVRKIDISQGIGINKTNASKECMFCHYWYLKDVGFDLLNHMFVTNATIY